MIISVVVGQVEFYISQTKADNHAVREAACACIAELGTKVSFFTLKLPYNCQNVNTLARENTFSKLEFIFLVVDDGVIKFSRQNFCLLNVSTATTLSVVFP